MSKQQLAELDSTMQLLKDVVRSTAADVDICSRRVLSMLRYPDSNKPPVVYSDAQGDWYSVEGVCAMLAAKYGGEMLPSLVVQTALSGSDGKSRCQIYLDHKDSAPPELLIRPLAKDVPLPAAWSAKGALSNLLYDSSKVKSLEPYVEELESLVRYFEFCVSDDARRKSHASSSGGAATSSAPAIVQAPGLQAPTTPTQGGPPSLPASLVLEPLTPQSARVSAAAAPAAPARTKQGKRAARAQKKAIEADAAGVEGTASSVQPARKKKKKKKIASGDAQGTSTKAASSGSQTIPSIDTLLDPATYASLTKRPRPPASASTASIQPAKRLRVVDQTSEATGPEKAVAAKASPSAPPASQTASSSTALAALASGSSADTLPSELQSVQTQIQSIVSGSAKLAVLGKDLGIIVDILAKEAGEVTTSMGRVQTAMAARAGLLLRLSKQEASGSLQQQLTARTEELELARGNNQLLLERNQKLAAELDAIKAEEAEHGSRQSMRVQIVQQHGEIAELKSQLQAQEVLVSNLTSQRDGLADRLRAILAGTTAGPDTGAASETSDTSEAECVASTEDSGKKASEVVPDEDAAPAANPAEEKVESSMHASPKTPTPIE
jgi:hypothetical protein